MTFSGVVGTSGANTGSLVKTSAGVLVLSATNGYTGGTTLSDGTLRVGNNAALGTGTLALNGGTLSSDGTTARSLTNSVTLGGNVTLGNATNTGALALSGTVGLGAATRTITTDSVATLLGIVSNGGLSKAGTSSLTLSGTNTYASGTTLSAGTLTLGNDSALGTGTLTISGSSTLDATADRAITNAMSIGSSFTFAGANTLTQSTGGIALTTSPTITVSASTLTLNGVVSGAGRALTKAGGGTLTLGAANTHDGGTTLSAGTLALGNNAALGTGTLTVSGAATLDVTGARTITNALSIGSSFTFAGTETLTQNTGGIELTTSPTITVSGATLALNGVVSGTGRTLTKAGSGILILGGANTYDTGTTLNAGTLRVNAAQSSTSVGALGELFTNGIKFNGGVLQYSSSNQYDYSPYVTALPTKGFRVDTNGENVSWFASALNASTSVGTPGLEKDGPGTLEFTGTFSNGGTTDVLDGTFKFRGSGSFGGAYSRNITLSSFSSSLEYSTSVNETLSGTISGNGSIVKSNSGVLTLSGASNSYAGGTTITSSFGLAGGLTLGSDSALGTGTLSIQANGTLDVTATRTITNNITVSSSFTFTGSALLTVNGQTTISSASTLTLPGSSLRLSGTTVYNARLTKAGTGILRLGNGSGSGGVTLSAGVLTLSGTTTPLGTDTFIINGGTVASSGSGGTFTNDVSVGGSFSASGSVVQNTGTVTLTTSPTISVVTGSLTVNGSISGSGRSITKADTGSLRLGALNTYDAGTTISGGTVEAAQTLALGYGAVSIASGAKLTALASISGKLDIGSTLTNSGGTLRIGGT